MISPHNSTLVLLPSTSGKPEPRVIGDGGTQPCRPSGVGAASAIGAERVSKTVSDAVVGPGAALGVLWVLVQPTNISKPVQTRMARAITAESSHRHASAATSRTRHDDHSCLAACSNTSTRSLIG
jgi:hypothetical protein